MTGQPFAEGETYYAALFEEAEGFVRRDYAEASWDGPPEGCFCYWRARIPVKNRQPLTMDLEALARLFCELEDETAAAKQRFRFLLALLLMRKRWLKLERSYQEGEAEYWELKLASDQSRHRVVNPQLSAQQVEMLSAQLTAILSGQLEALDMVETAQPQGENEAEGEAEPAAEGHDEPPAADDDATARDQVERKDADGKADG